MNFGTARFHFLIFSKGLHVLTFKKKPYSRKTKLIFLISRFQKFLETIPLTINFFFKVNVCCLSLLQIAAVDVKHFFLHRSVMRVTKLEQVLGHQRICGKNFLPSGFF